MRKTLASLTLIPALFLASPDLDNSNVSCSQSTSYLNQPSVTEANSDNRNSLEDLKKILYGGAAILGAIGVGAGYFSFRLLREMKKFNG